MYKIILCCSVDEFYVWVTPACTSDNFFPHIIAISPAELAQLSCETANWVSSTDLFVMFHWLTPVKPRCKLWDHAFSKWEQNLKISGVLLACVRHKTQPGLQYEQLTYDLSTESEVQVKEKHCWFYATTFHCAAY